MACKKSNICFLLMFTAFGSPSGPCAADCPDTGGIERRLQGAGLVNVQSLDSTVMVDLIYSGSNNFLHQDLYGGLCRCYLTKEAAGMLARAQSALRKKRPHASIVALDCARPQSVQRKMWDRVKGTAGSTYVANPDKGSLHSYGCAVDVTLADSSGTPLDMGTPFDFFGELAQPRYEEKFFREGKLTARQVANRKLLRDSMREAGFIPLATEWWHFNAFPKNQVKARFPAIE
jgi:zinc D-Ala-D-Ala dipeptidase